MKNAMSLRGCVASVAITIPLFLLAACGDDITEQYNANVGAVETSKDLPECTKDIAGQTAFVSETHEFLGCDGKEWQTLSANTVSVGDNVCSSTSLSDDSGFEIFCNGKSIGKVKNGEKGDAGTPGAKGEAGTNGTGCKIQESTALTATIACGSETFTMDLTGYVDVPEACDTTDTDCAKPLNNVDLSGVSQKGPFVSGTDVTAYELENGKSLKQTGKTFGGKIENKDGSFNIRTVKLKSSFAYLVADGFYRNEVTGKNSAATIKLRALTNLDGRKTANINLVTHLEYDRVQRLVTKENKSVIEAKRAAEKSLFAAFGIDNANFKGFAEDFNILKEGDGNAALLAVSAMLQGDRNESELTALLAALSIDLGDNGEWDDSLQRAQVADWAMKADLEGGLSKIRANVEGWKLSTSKAPAFEGHVKNFWMKELGVDDCDSDNNGALFAVKNTYSSFYAANDSAYTEGDSSLVRLICAASGDSYKWRLATDIEKDTAALAKDLPADTAVSGKINTGLVYVKESGWRHGTELDKTLKFSCVANKKGATDTMTVDYETKWFICSDELVYVDGERVSTAWRPASTAEADTAGFGIPQATEDSVKIGRVNKLHYYVYDGGKWRFGTELDFGLGPCIEDKLGNVKNLGDVNKPEDQKDPNLWYICVNNEYVLVEDFRVPTTWRKASDLEMDTYGWLSAEEGSIRNGSVNENLTYVFEKGKWRLGTRMDNVLGLSCILDRRDTVVQEKQFTWYKCFADTADDLSILSSWRKVEKDELDMSYWNCFKDTLGKFLKGPYSGKMMVWDADTLREPDSVEISFGRACVSYMYGNVYELEDYHFYSCENTWDMTPRFLRDARDSSVYKVVKVGSQIWMAENLYYEYKVSKWGADSVAYGVYRNPDCDTCGLYYTWAAAMDSAGIWSTNGKGCGDGWTCSPTYPVRGVCPEGWHLPNNTEWNTLYSAMNSSPYAMQAKDYEGWPNAKDTYGFSVLPAGVAINGKFYSVGSAAIFWSATEYGRNVCNAWYVEATKASLVDHNEYAVAKDSFQSVRCLKD